MAEALDRDTARNTPADGAVGQDASPREPWNAALRSIGIADARLLAVSAFDPDRRTYVRAGRVYKIRLLGPCSGGSSSTRACTLREEAEILRRLDGLECVPRNPEFAERAGVEFLSYDFVEGTPISELRCGPLRRLRLIGAGGWPIARVSFRGVAHRDIFERNLLASARGSVVLLDFDQAQRTKIGQALASNFFGCASRGVRPFGWYTQVFMDSARRLLPRWLLPRGLYERIVFASTEPPRIPATAPPILHKLRAAWVLARQSDANSPGVPIAYYELTELGYRFPGERPWAARWTVLRDAADVHGKRVIELGCNLSLLSCFLLRERSASACFAVDADAGILAAAQHVADAYGVSPQYKRVDFDEPGRWEDDLRAFRPDVVFALNVLNWVRDKDRFLRFLGGFDEVVFEGHDAVEVEVERFRQLGFAAVRQIGVSERNREILRFRKQAD